MADPTQGYSEQIAALRQRDPRFAQMMGQTRGWGPFRSNRDDLLQYLAAQGINVPEDMHINRAGFVSEDLPLGEFLLKGGAMVGGGLLGAHALGGALGGGGAAAGGGMAAQNVAPFSGLPGGIGAGGGAGGAAAGAGLAAQTASGFNMGDLLKYIVGGGAVVGGLTGAGQPDMPQGMEDLLGLQKRRLEASNPLYESVLRLAFSRMPTGATQGLPTPQLK
jgi:hypothetical protein